MPLLQEQWCIPKPSAEFVERMEDVLEVYKKPYDPLRPVVCMDANAELAVWKAQRNLAQKGVDWKFTADDARVRLKRLYSVIL